MKTKFSVTATFPICSGKNTAAALRGGNLYIPSIILNGTVPCVYRYRSRGVAYRANVDLARASIISLYQCHIQACLRVKSALPCAWVSTGIFSAYALPLWRRRCAAQSINNGAREKRAYNCNAAFTVARQAGERRRFRWWCWRERSAAGRAGA